MAYSQDHKAVRRTAAQQEKAERMGTNPAKRAGNSGNRTKAEMKGGYKKK